MLNNNNFHRLIKYIVAYSFIFYKHCLKYKSGMLENSPIIVINHPFQAKRLIQLLFQKPEQF